MRVHVNRAACIGSGQCAATAPGVFDQSDEDGIVLLLQPHPPEAVQAATRRAASLCPALAIRVDEAPAS